jgi:O-antigen/teichoic acid export membrane protein
VLVVGVGRAARLAIDFAATIWLMRKLGPEPYGLVGMAIAFINAFGAVGDAGIGASMVSDPRLTPQRVGAGVMSATLLALLVVALGAVVTPLIVAFYGEPRLYLVWPITTLSIAFSIVTSVPSSLAQRAQQFFLLSWLPCVVSLAASSLAIAMAEVRSDFWPILSRQVGAAGLGLILIWVFVRPEVAWPTREDFREVARFGRGIVGFTLLNFFNRNADDILVGRYLGKQALGLYGLSYRLLRLPIAEVEEVVNTIVYPRLSKLAPDSRAVAEELGLVMRDIALVLSPPLFGAAIAAPDVVAIAFGKDWLPAIVPLQVFCLLGIFQATTGRSGLAYVVSRNTGRMVRWALFATPLTVASFVVGLPWGIEGVAVSYAVVSVIVGVPLVGMAAGVLGVPGRVLGRRIAEGMLVGLVASIPVVTAYWAGKSWSGSPALALAMSALVALLVETGICLRLLPRWR